MALMRPSRVMPPAAVLAPRSMVPADDARVPAPAVRLLALAAMAAAGFAVTLTLVTSGTVDSGDRRALVALHDQLQSWGVASAAERIFRLAEAAGGTVGLPVLLGLVAAALLAMRRRWLRVAGVAATVAGGTVLSEVIFKNLVARQRPDIVPGINVDAGYSFPSGHATQAMCGILCMALVIASVTSGRWLRRLILSAAVVAVVLIDLSRLVLLAHWPSDVVGGTLLGAAWSASVWAAVLIAETHSPDSAR